MTSVKGELADVGLIVIVSKGFMGAKYAIHVADKCIAENYKQIPYNMPK